MAAAGGNKKRASPSDENYWKRAQMSKYSETHRARRIARHAKRMGKPENYTAGSDNDWQSGTAPKPAAGRPKRASNEYTMVMRHTRCPNPTKDFMRRS